MTTFLPWMAGDQSSRIQAALTSIGANGTVVLEAGNWEFSPGGIAFTADGQTLAGISTSGTILTLNGPLQSSAPGISLISVSDTTLRDMTLDGQAFVQYNYTLGVALSGTPTFNVTNGQTYRVAIRGTSGSTLTISGPFASSLVVTAIGMSAGATVVYGWVTATGDGTATMTPSGSVNYVSVMENGAGISDGSPLVGLISIFNCDRQKINNVSLVNIDTQGISINAFKDADFLVSVERTPTWDQNNAILAVSNAINPSQGLLIRAGSSFVGSGLFWQCDNVTVEAGVTIGGIGYGSCFTASQGTNHYLGTCQEILPNMMWADMDNTPPHVFELYGSGTLAPQRIIKNPSEGISVCSGDGTGTVSSERGWLIDTPYVYNTGAYYAQYGLTSQAGISYLYLTANLQAVNCRIINPQCGDDRSGSLGGAGPNRAPVVAATTTNITLSGLQTIDGVAVNNGDRVLVQAQSSAADNGIYNASTGAWTRSTDMNTWSAIVGATVLVTGGMVNASSLFASNATSGGTLGTTPILFNECRTQGYGIADNSSSVQNTVTTGIDCNHGNISGPTSFLSTANRIVSYAQSVIYGYGTNGDSDLIWAFGITPQIVDFTTNLTANRTVTLAATGAAPGMPCSIVRHALGAFTLLVQNDVGVALVTLPASTQSWADFAFNGTHFVLVRTSTL